MALKIPSNLPVQKNSLCNPQLIQFYQNSISNSIANEDFTNLQLLTQSLLNDFNLLDNDCLKILETSICLVCQNDGSEKELKKINQTTECIKNLLNCCSINRNKSNIFFTLFLFFIRVNQGNKNLELFFELEDLSKKHKETFQEIENLFFTSKLKKYFDFPKIIKYTNVLKKFYENEIMETVFISQFINFKALDHLEENMRFGFEKIGQVNEALKTKQYDQVSCIITSTRNLSHFFTEKIANMLFDQMKEEQKLKNSTQVLQIAKILNSPGLLCCNEDKKREVLDLTKLA